MNVLEISLALGIAMSVTQAAPSIASAPAPMPLASVMHVVDAALAPLPYVKFCMQMRDACNTDGISQLIALDVHSLGELAQVNRAVNRQIRPIQKSVSGEIETWTIDPESGDCNDYAISKRQQLIARGFPRSALLLAMAITPRGEGHLVLVARTDHGDFVLDNLREAVVAWNSLPYRWLRRESVAHPLRWEKLEPRDVPRNPRISRVLGQSADRGA